LNSRMKKLLSLVREKGVLGFLKETVSRIRSFVFSYRPVYIYGISAPPSPNLKARCSLEIHRGTEQNIHHILELMAYMDRSAALQRIKEGFEEEYEPFVAFSEGKVAHVSWLFHPPEVKETLVVFHLHEDQCSIGACLTSPEFRGMNIYPVVLQSILQEVVKRGAKAAFIAAAPSNTASIRGIEKAGFRLIETVRGFRLFGKMFNHHWYAPEKLNGC